MSETKPDSSSTAVSWGAYWQGALDSDNYRGGGVGHPAVAAFWDEQLRVLEASIGTARVLDIGSGDGAVMQRMASVCQSALPRVVCLDISEPAIRRLTASFPGVGGIVADAKSVPFVTGAFDLVTSQFGVEYAGVEAVDAAVRLVTSGGRLALLLHIEGGAMHTESLAGLDALRRIRDCELIERSIAMFEAGFAAVRGADPNPYRRAANALMPCFRELEAIMRERGKHVAGDTVLRLYNDIDGIHASMAQYDPQEVLDWLTTMGRELVAFSGRLESMCEAAVDEDRFGRVCESLIERDFILERAEPLTARKPQLPLAWALVASKR